MGIEKCLDAPQHDQAAITRPHSQLQRAKGLCDARGITLQEQTSRQAMESLANRQT